MNERTEAQLEHRERQIGAIRRMTIALFSKQAVDELVRETLEIATDVLCADAGSVLLHEPSSDTLVFRYALGPSAAKLIGYSMPATQGIAGRVFSSGIADLASKVDEQSDFHGAVDQATGYHTESMLTVPLQRFEAQPIGVMQILNSRREFDSHDLEVLEVLCAQAAAAIEHAKLAEQARRAQIVNLLGDVSHDIKNMLTPIRSGLLTLLPLLDEVFGSLDELAGEGPQGRPWGEAVRAATAAARDDYRWILENALDSADQVQSRTREIADAVKGEISEPVFTVADLNDTVLQVGRLLRPLALAAELQFKLELDPELPLMEFDGRQMYNAIYNLINNSIPETPAGGTITVRTSVENHLAGPHCLLEVCDTGRGMPEHVRQRLFTDQAVSTRPGGTGLGTRIVASVVRRHHGSIEVDSQEGRGSTFRIRLPLMQLSEDNSPANGAARGRLLGPAVE